MPHPTTTLPKCTATNKHGRQCGEVAVRKGLCTYHQPEVQRRRLLVKLERARKQEAQITKALNELP